MKITQIIAFCFLLITLLPSDSKAQASFTEVVGNIELLVANFPAEKVYVHTDRPYYAVGDDVWMAAYVVNGNDHAEDPVSGFLMVELVDPQGKIIKQRHVQLDGKFGDTFITIPQTAKPGKYLIRGFTAYMLNYSYEYAFAREIEVFSKEDEVQEDGDTFVENRLRFFPEGGELVAGIPNKVAFEVSDTSAKQIEVLDMGGNVVATGKVMHQGIGFFNLTPSVNGGYMVKLNRKRFPLPSVLAKGYGITVNNLRKDELYVDVSCTPEYDLTGGYIIGHIRGLVFLQKEGLSGQKGALKISKEGLPDGVAQFTLFSARGKPVAERAVFLDHNTNAVSVKSSIPYEYINTRQMADLKIALAEADGIALDGDLSVSIVDAGLVFDQEKASNIRSYLLLGSEFTGMIPNINSYFSADNKKTAFYLDLLMMTKGWTKIRWPDVMTGNFAKLSIAPQQGFEVSGVVMKRGEPIAAKVELSVVKDVYSGDVVSTDANGRFRITLEGIQDSSQIYLKAYIPNTLDPTKPIDTKDLYLSLSPSLRYDVESENIQNFDGGGQISLEKYLDQSYKIRSIDSIYDAAWSIELEEVSIKAKDLSVDRQLQRDFSIPYSTYSSRVMFDSLATGVQGRSVFDVVRDYVPGVEVFGTAGIDQRFRVRGGSSSIIGSNDSKILLDGIEVSIETVNGLNVDRIAFVDVLKGAATSIIYGGANGVVAIYTKQATKENVIRDYKMPDNAKSIDYQGFVAVREFYSPDYSKAFAGSEKPDLRTTLYWNPRITTEGGVGSASFYTSDKSTRYIIEVQGLTKDGRPFVGYDKMEVR